MLLACHWQWTVQWPMVVEHFEACTNMAGSSSLDLVFPHCYQSLHIVIPLYLEVEGNLRTYNWSLGQLSKESPLSGYSIHPLYSQDWSWDRKHVSCGFRSQSHRFLDRGPHGKHFRRLHHGEHDLSPSWRFDILRPALGCKPIAFRQHRNPEHIDYTKQSNSCRPIMMMMLKQ